MNGGKEKGKGLRAEDAALWEKVARTVKPLPGKPDSAAFRKMIEQALHEGEKSGKVSPLATAKKALKTSAPCMPAQRQRPPHPAPQPPAKQPPKSATAGGLDRRTRQRMARGNVEIEARLDLHGLGAEMARVRLRSFLADCRKRGLRTVLVITGKGASPYARHTLHGHDLWHAPERKGRLRRLAPQWLAEADLAHHVAGFQQAHPRHGGGGAFYVRLRRKDRGRAP